MRVTVVRITGGSVMFAPHTGGAPWIAVQLDDNDGEPPALGEVGELLVDDQWIFDVDPGARAELCTLAASGPPNRMTFRLPGRIDVDLSGHGLPPAFKGKAANQLKFWRLVPAGTVVGHYDHPDVTAWPAELDERERRDKHRNVAKLQLQRRRAMLDNAQDHFVNPYTFVPFTEQPPQRKEPAGHHTLGPGSDDRQRFQGTITARLVTRSPLLVRNVGSAAPMVGGVARAARTPAGDLFVPGSSVHGAIRALHETLTGSCMRVFDPDFVPVYRDVASAALREGWSLGVVESTDDKDGRPTRLTRCSETKWVLLTTLLRVMDTVVTGQRFTLDDAKFARQDGRDVYPDGDADITPDPGGRWIVHITDDAARDDRHPYYCAIGRVPDTPDAVELTDRAWAAFQQAAEGSKQHYAGRNEARPDMDAERRRLAEPDTTLADVLGRSTQKISRGRAVWLRPRPWLHPGQVVWLGPAGGRFVSGIALSYLWRTAGHGSTGARLDKGFEACHDPNGLCPSCTVFGSADTRDTSEKGVDRRLAEQLSYRGHIRVLDAVLESGGVLDEPVTLPAAGSPRPGSGQFYLQDPNGAKATPEYQKPRNRWGVPDGTKPRGLRGRKFYWHTDPEVDERRSRWKRHDHAPEGDRVELVARGSVYRLRLTFDGLSRSELSGLVATLQPELLFTTREDPLPYPTETDPRFAFHLGGGKPIGLGSCQVEDLTVAADTVESRYLNTAQAPQLDPSDLVAAFAAEHADRLTVTWQNVAAALHTGHVDSRIVAYPTALAWLDDNGGCVGEKQHRSFAWFQNSTGEGVRHGLPKPFVALPAVSDIAPALPVDARRTP